MGALTDVLRKAAQEAKDVAGGKQPVRPNRAERKRAERVKKKLEAVKARRKHEGRRPPRG